MIGKCGEPWIKRKTEIIDSKGKFVAAIDWAPNIHALSSEDAERVVQTMNACAGIDDPVVMEREDFEKMQIYVDESMRLIDDNIKKAMVHHPDEIQAIIGKPEGTGIG